MRKIIYVSCEKEEDAKALIPIVNKLGLKWRDGKEFNEKNLDWDKFKEQSVYQLSEHITFSPKGDSSEFNPIQYISVAELQKALDDGLLDNGFEKYEDPNAFVNEQKAALDELCSDTQRTKKLFLKQVEMLKEKDYLSAHSLEILDKTVEVLPDDYDPKDICLLISSLLFLLEPENLLKVADNIKTNIIPVKIDLVIKDMMVNRMKAAN